MHVDSRLKKGRLRNSSFPDCLYQEIHRQVTGANRRIIAA
ncbi:hypothetical protein VCBJG01_0286 [Vibrio cholerae BJG-01]|nr:hypothetical protein VCBJG01_0286 [Vibrio cholerae BJG-01]KFD86434.1 hypothetical protein DN42_3282 [Vibrio cholerae]